MQAKVLTKKLKPLKLETIKSRHNMQMNSMKYFMTMELPVTNMKLLEVNENFGLDCEEFDDNVTRIKNQIDRLNDTFNKKISETNELEGIEYLEMKVADEKKQVLKDFVDELAQKRREINLKINQLDVRIDAKVNESEDEISKIKREGLQKINEQKKSFNLKIEDLDLSLLKDSEKVEKELLNEFDKAKVKNLLKGEVELRKQYIKQSSNLNEENVLTLLRINKNNAENLFNFKVENENEICDLRLKKLEYKRDIDVIVEQIKARDEYYLNNTLSGSITYLLALQNKIKSLITEYNEKAYLLNKDIIQNKMKQVRFIEKEFMQISKNISALISSNLESLQNFYPQLIEFSQLKIEEKHYSKIIDAFSEFVNDKRSFYIECCENYLISQLGVIRYINFDSSSYTNRLVSEVSSYFDTLLNEISSLSNECDNNKIKQMFKKYNQIDSSFAKIVKNVLKDFNNDCKTYIDTINKPKIIDVNSLTITVDEKFKNVTLLDNSNSLKLIDEYESKSKQYSNSTLDVSKVISTIGVKSNEAFEVNKKDVINASNELKQSFKVELESNYVKLQNDCDNQIKAIRLEEKNKYKFL